MSLPIARALSPVGVIAASVAASLVASWGVSAVFALRFQPSIVAVLSAAMAAAAIASERRRRD